MKNLYGGVQHPYYVLAPDYQRQSAGIRVMHQFCAALRRCGQEAWISAGKVNPELDTPLLTAEVRQRHAETGRMPIAVYPEVIGRNPFQSHVVTRYILNKPGLLGEKPQYKETDLLFTYATELQQQLPNAWGVLFLPCIDSSVFHNRENPDDPHRKGWCVYPGRYKQGLIDHQSLLADCAVITRDWPQSHEEMAALFRRSEGVYCFENTAISLEARLCGCPVVHLPSPFYDHKQLMGTELGLAWGISYSCEPREIDAARRQLPELSAAYESHEAAFWEGLDRWISDTQALATQVAKNPPPPLADETPLDDPAYRAWYLLNSPGETHAQHLATRMVQSWKTVPSVHLLMAVHEEELAAFEQSLNTLKVQVFGNWMLTVVTTEPKPSALQAQNQVQWLQARDAAHLDIILHEMAKASGGEWLGILTPGTQLDALSLQAMVDATQTQAEVQLVYCDDDVQTSDGRSHSARFKPLLDFITLCGASMLQGFTLMRQSAYVAAIQSPAIDHSPADDLALHLLARGQADVIVRVHGVWAHRPEQPHPPTADGDCQVVTEVLQQAHIKAEVQPRNAAHLRIVQPSLSFASTPVTVLVLGADTLEAFLAQWRQLLSVVPASDLEACMIANRLTSPTDTQLLRAAVSMESRLATTIVDVPGLCDGEALAALCHQVISPLTWILGPNTFPMQTEGLQHLVAWMNWPGVAAVQPGLWDMRSNRMLSPGFAPGLVWEPLHLQPETIDNTPTQQRQLASLNGDAVLVQTAALRQAMQSMSTGDKSVWALALSHQLSHAGLQMVWKPEVVCGLQAVSSSSKNELSRRFLAQNLTWLTGNGPYNPRLSLRKPALVDAQRSTPWLGLNSEAPRYLLLQENPLFPKDHLTQIAQAGEATGATVTLWTVSPTDSVDVLLLEIVRAAPSVVYFSHHPAQGVLANTLALLVEHCPNIKRVCCVASLSADATPVDNWVLLDWLTLAQRALSKAHRVLVTDPAQAEALKPYHPNVQCSAELVPSDPPGVNRGAIGSRSSMN